MMKSSQVEISLVPRSMNTTVTSCCISTSVTARVQLSVYTVSTYWHSELGYDTPSRYLALAGTPLVYYAHNSDS